MGHWPQVYALGAMAIRTARYRVPTNSDMSDKSIASPAQSSRQRVVMLALLAILLMSASVFLTGRKDSDTIVVTFPSGRQLEAEVADTPEKLLFGLAFREGLPPNAGMLYIFDESGSHRLRTRGYKLAVDMIWLDESRHVVHIVDRVPACPGDPCPLYGPSQEQARYVIQANAGFAQQEQLSNGAELKFALRM